MAQNLRQALAEAVKTGLLGQLGTGASMASVTAGGVVARVVRFHDRNRIYRWSVGPVGEQVGSRSAASPSAELACQAAADAVAEVVAQAEAPRLRAVG